MSKTIQIKFGNKQENFNNWKEAAVYTVSQIDKTSKTNKQKILNAIQEFELNPNSGTLIHGNQLRKFLFND